MWRKRLIGLGLASLGIYMCIFFRFTMTRVQNELKIAAKALDLDLVSIEDYTISGKIDKAFYQKALRYLNMDRAYDYTEDGRSRNTPIMKFKKYLTDVIEKEIKNGRVEQNVAGLEEKGISSEVADITFQFSNNEMLELLRKRNKNLTSISDVIENMICCRRCRRGRKQKKLILGSVGEDSERLFEVLSDN